MSSNTQDMVRNLGETIESLEEEIQDLKDRLDRLSLDYQEERRQNSSSLTKIQAIKLIREFLLEQGLVKGVWHHEAKKWVTDWDGVGATLMQLKNFLEAQYPKTKSNFG